MARVSAAPEYLTLFTRTYSIKRYEMVWRFSWHQILTFNTGASSRLSPPTRLVFTLSASVCLDREAGAVVDFAKVPPFPVPLLGLPRSTSVPVRLYGRLYPAPLYRRAVLPLSARLYGAFARRPGVIDRPALTTALICLPRSRSSKSHYRNGALARRNQDAAPPPSDTDTVLRLTLTSCCV